MTCLTGECVGWVEVSWCVQTKNEAQFSCGEVTDKVTEKYDKLYNNALHNCTAISIQIFPRPLILIDPNSIQKTHIVKWVCLSSCQQTWQSMNSDVLQIGIMMSLLRLPFELFIAIKSQQNLSSFWVQPTLVSQMNLLILTATTGRWQLVSISEILAQILAQWFQNFSMLAATNPFLFISPTFINLTLFHLNISPLVIHLSAPPSLGTTVLANPS